MSPTRTTMRRYTRYGTLHPIRRGAMPTDRVQRTRTQDKIRTPRGGGAWLHTHGQQRRHQQPNFARNLSWSLFEMPQKRCNSNDANSTPEQVAGELRAKSMRRAAGPGRALKHRARLRCPWAGPGRAIHSDQAPLVWRAPEGPEGQAAVPVGGGGAWPGFEPTRRAQLAARTASGRAAAHGHTKQPGPTAHHAAPGTPVGPQATPSMRRAAAHRHTQRPGPTRHTTRSRPAPSGPGGTRVRRQLSEAAAQPTLHVAPSRPSATVTPAAARRSRSSSARAQSLAARAADRSSRTA